MMAVVLLALALATPETAQRPLARSRSGTGPATATVEAAVVRAGAITKPTPRYPDESAKARIAGVAVAQILIALDGKVERVDVLEAPDRAIGESVRAALFQWTFPPTTMPDPANPSKQVATKVSAKLAFYFELRHGKPAVLSPEEKSGGAAGAGHTTLEADNRSQVAAISESEYAALKRTARPVLLDTRRRDAFRARHRDGAINIPFDEIAARAAAEIPAGRQVVLDCPNPQANWTACMSAARVLRELGFSKIAVIRP